MLGMRRKRLERNGTDKKRSERNEKPWNGSERNGNAWISEHNGKARNATERIGTQRKRSEYNGNAQNSSERNGKARKPTGRFESQREGSLRPMIMQKYVISTKRFEVTTSSSVTSNK